MGEDLGFTAEDRKILNQLPVILQRLNEKFDETTARVSRVEDAKANRIELAELERQIIIRLDVFREWVLKIDKEKADRAELANDEVKDHETRIRSLERTKYWTIGWSAGASVIIVAIAWVIELLVKR